MLSFDGDVLIVFGVLIGAFVLAVLVGVLVPRVWPWRGRRGAWLAFHRAGDERSPSLVTLARPRSGATARDGSVDALRLRRVDAASGRLLAEQYVPGPVAFLGARERELWFVSGPWGLHARDADSLAVTVDEPRLVERNAALHGRLSAALDDYRFDARVGVVMRDRAGYEHVLDVVSLVARYSVGAWRVPLEPPSDRLRDGTAVVIEGRGGPQSLRVRPPGAAPDVEVHAFGEGALLRDDEGRLLELAAPTSVLLRHRVLSDGSVTVSRVRVDSGEAVWWVTTDGLGLTGDAPDVLGGAVVGDVVLLKATGERDELVCVDAATGAALWRREV